jgi:AhpD family alkylhydroperoxidase
MKTNNPSIHGYLVFQRRYYASLKQYWQDLAFLISRPRQILKTLRNFDHTFRERLMMVVTEVNQCRYCKTFHSKLAVIAGVKRAELQCFSTGQFNSGTPSEELLALRYARHWAETHVKPNHDNYHLLKQYYGEDTATAIDLTLRLIWIGNLSGNTWDYWLYRLSNGRLGQ